MWSYFIDAINSTEITTESAVFKMALSMLLGGIVGYERKRKGQIAGVRTFALIAMGSTLAMILSIYVPQIYCDLKNGDPGRIAAQIITGIGFLGAGAIIQMKGSVRGLTTAAGIWMVATIGMAVGIGLYILAGASTLLIIFILVMFERYEKRVNLIWETKTICINVNAIITSIDDYKALFKKFQVHIIDEYLNVDYTARTTTINFVILLKDKSDYLTLFEEIKELYDTNSISLSNEIKI